MLIGAYTVYVKTRIFQPALYLIRIYRTFGLSDIYILSTERTL